MVQICLEEMGSQKVQVCYFVPSTTSSTVNVSDYKMKTTALIYVSVFDFILSIFKPYMNVTKQKNPM